VSAPHSATLRFIANGKSTTNVHPGTNPPFRFVSSAATDSATPVVGSGEAPRTRRGEILQAGDLVACDGRPQARGERGVDFDTEVGLDVSVLRLGEGVYDPDHWRSGSFMPRGRKVII